MNKQELIKQIADKVKISQKEVELILNNLFQKIEADTANGKVTKSKNFGTFFVKKRKARTIKVFGKKLMKVAETQVVGFWLKRNFKKIIAAIAINDKEPIKEITETPNKKEKIEVSKTENNNVNTESNKEETGISKTTETKKGDIKAEKTGFENVETKDYKAKEGGKIVELNAELITGNRKNSAREETIFEPNYRGKIGYEVIKNFVQWTDKPDYPIISLPAKDALVLEAYTPKNNSTKGVCENLFYEELTKYFTNIRRNLILPIKNRKYGYQPDLVYVDESCNLFIDIEIDEPYDGVTRKPTHYHNSYDRARDYYFNEQGWVVIRFTEEQVYKERQSCCKKIAELVDKLTKSSLLTTFEDVFDLTPAKSWTFEEAKAMALENYRENYLGISFAENHTIDEEIEIESYGSSQTTGIGTVANIKILDIEFSPSLLQKKQEIENLIGKHIRFEYGKNDVTDLVKIIRVEQNRNQLFMLGYSLIDNAENRYELRLIEDFEVIENPILMQGNTPQEIEACLDFAIENFKAAFIAYHSKSKDEYKERTISKIHYHFSDGTRTGLRYIPVYYATGYIYNVRINFDKNNYTLTKSDIQTFCHLQKEADGRWFVNDGRIKFIKVLNTEYTNREILDVIRMYYNDKAYYLIVEQKYKEAKNKLDIALKIAPNNLWCLGNLAHTYLLLGEYDRAIEIYTTHKGKNLSEKTSWEDMVKSDFAEFAKSGIICNDFEKVLALLDK